MTISTTTGLLTIPHIDQKISYMKAIVEDTRASEATRKKARISLMMLEKVREKRGA